MLTKYLSLLEHTIRWHFPASFETGYGITGLQSMEYGWIYTYHFQVSQRIEVKDSGPSGHGRSKLYFICSCSLPHLPRGLHGSTHGHRISLLPMRQIPSHLNIRHGHVTKFQPMEQKQLLFMSHLSESFKRCQNFLLFFCSSLLS